jgi:hypothetical protein
MENKISTQELNYLINSHTQFDPRHAFSDLMRDGFGINHDLQFPQGSIMNDICGADRRLSKKRFKALYSDYRRYINQVDPAGGMGLESHI